MVSFIYKIMLSHKQLIDVLSLVLQVFDDLQKMLSVTENQLQNSSTHSKPVNTKTLQMPGTIINTSPLLRMVLGLFVALATVSMGIYAF